MLQPMISVVIETVTVRENAVRESIAPDMAMLCAALDRQTYPAARIEILIVVDPQVSIAERQALRAMFTAARLIEAAAANYFAAKNAGIAAARGEIVALIDSDCVPATDWLERLSARFEPGVIAVAGRTRYVEGSFAARTCSVPDFGYVLAQHDGQPSGMLINNLALWRGMLPARPFDARIPRNGGCCVLFNQLKASGARIVFEGEARVEHALDVAGFGFLRKHFDRGRDSVIIYRLDEQHLFRATAVVRRFGALGLAALAVRHILVDWHRLCSYRQQLGLTLFSLPWYWLVAIVMRATELIGSWYSMLSHYPACAADGSLQHKTNP